jgi:curli production assembly/transport component CsgE
MRLKIVPVVCAISLATASTLCLAQNPAAEPLAMVQQPSRAMQDQYGGLLIDHTITVGGHAFYQEFASLWREQALADRYVITVHEQPAAQRGTLIWIEYGQERVYQAYLPVNRAKVPALAREAIDLCYQNVVDAETRQLLFRDQDMARSEI